MPIMAGSFDFGMHMLALCLGLYYIECQNVVVGVFSGLIRGIIIGFCINSYIVLWVFCRFGIWQICLALFHCLYVFIDITHCSSLRVGVCTILLVVA